MLSLAREASGLTQSALAQEAGVTQSTISKFEHDLIEDPDPDVLAACSRILGVDSSYFYRQEQRRGASVSFYRRRKSITTTELRQLEAQLQMLRLDVGKLMLAVNVKSDIRLPDLDPSEVSGGARECARRTRAAWMIPSGPIHNLIRQIEAAGILVIEIDWSAKFDAMSMRASDGIPPIIFINIAMPTDRMRFTLAHELGHLVMHTIPTDEMEREADAFASEFLAPSDEIKPALRNLKMTKLRALKTKWRISMMALVKTARSLETLTANQYRYMCTQLRKSPHFNDDVHIPTERPELFEKIISFHREQLGYSLGDLARCLHLPQDVFCAKYGLEQVPRLVLVSEEAAPSIPAHVGKVVEFQHMGASFQA